MTDNLPVMPIVRPTVPNADMTSNISGKNGKSGSANTRQKTMVKQKPELSTATARLLNRNLGSMVRLKSVKCSLCLMKLYVPNRITTVVVSFIPPAVEVEPPR